MKIGSMPSVTKGIFNPNSAKAPPTSKTGDEIKSAKGDSSSISSFAVKLSGSKGKKNSMIESLQQRKEQTSEMKQEFLKTATENGKDSKYINEKIKEFDEQISQIDREIFKIKIEEQKKNLGTDLEEIKEAQEKKAETKEQTPEEVQTKVAASLVSLSNGINDIEKMMSMRTNLINNAKIKEMEISSSYGSSASSGVGSQQEALDKIYENIDNITANIGEKIKVVSEKAVEQVGKSDKATENKQANGADETAKPEETKGTSEAKSENKPQEETENPQ